MLGITISSATHQNWKAVGMLSWLNTLSPRQNGCHFADEICKCIFLNENGWILINISLKFVPKGQINNIPALVQIMAWYRPDNKPLSEPMLVSLLTQICVIPPQWVKEATVTHLATVHVVFSNNLSTLVQVIACYLQATNWIDVDSSLMRSFGFHVWTVSPEMHQILIIEMCLKIAYLNWQAGTSNCLAGTLINIISAMVLWMK